MLSYRNYLTLGFGWRHSRFNLTRTVNCFLGHFWKHHRLLNRCLDTSITNLTVEVVMCLGIAKTCIYCINWCIWIFLLDDIFVQFFFTVHFALPVVLKINSGLWSNRWLRRLAQRGRKMLSDLSFGTCLLIKRKLSWLYLFVKLPLTSRHKIPFDLRMGIWDSCRFYCIFVY